MAPDEAASVRARSVLGRAQDLGPGRGATAGWASGDDLLHVQWFRGLTIVPGKQADLLQVHGLGVGGKVAKLHRLNHALA
jgi:hypothetical protein